MSEQQPPPSRQGPEGWQPPPRQLYQPPARPQHTAPAPPPAAPPGHGYPPPAVPPGYDRLGTPGWGTPPPRRKRRHTGRNVLIGVGILVALAIVGSVAGGGDGQTPTAVTEAPAAPAAGDGQQPAKPKPAAPKPMTYSGSGSKVIRVKSPWVEEPGLVTLRHDGAANFVAWTVTAAGKEQELLVNEIGAYQGTHVYNMERGTETAAFKIQADGSWRMTLKPLAAARAWSGPRISGRGDQVLRLDSKGGLETLTATHHGEANFVVRAYGEGIDLLFNEIGTFRGETLLPGGAVLVAVTADGRWTLARG